MSEYIQVVTNTDSEAEARRIARTLVEQRLGASAQVSGPVTSMYWWKGRIETGPEWQCAVKTRRELYLQVEQTIQRLHSYEVPAVLALPIQAGLEPYLNWLDEAVRGGEDSA